MFFAVTPERPSTYTQGYKYHRLRTDALGVVGPGVQSTSSVSLHLLALPPSMKVCSQPPCDGRSKYSCKPGTVSFPKSSHESSRPDHVCVVVGPHAHQNPPQWWGKQDTTSEGGQGMVIALLPHRGWGSHHGPRENGCRAAEPAHARCTLGASHCDI